MFNKKRNKKGSIIDIFVMLAILFGFTLAIIFGYKIIKAINTQISGMPDDVVNPATKTMYKEKFFDRMPVLFDKLFLFLFIGFTLVTLIGAYYIDTSPFFFVIGLIIISILLLLSVILSNVYGGIVSSPDMAEIPATFPILNFFMANYLTVAIVEVFLVVIVLYAKPKEAML